MMLVHLAAGVAAAVASVVPMQCAPAPSSPVNCTGSIATSTGSITCSPGPFDGTTQFRSVIRFSTAGADGWARGPWVTCCGPESKASMPLYAVIEGGRVEFVGFERQ